MKDFGEIFKITNETDYFRGKNGFKAYNPQGKCVGVIFMTDDKRVAAYGNCELCVYPEFKNRYGEWHRIRSHGSRIKYQHLCNILSRQSSYSLYID